MSDVRSRLSGLQAARKRQMRLAGLSVAPLLALVSPYGHPEGMASETIEFLGAALIFAAVIGRTWCTLYIGGRKREALVTTGPYSLSRNPLYVFSLLGALGIGLATGSIAAGLLLSGLAFFILAAVVRHEEDDLLASFGATYRDYRDTTPRWLALSSRWRDADEISVCPALVVRTFRDSSLMLLCLPLIEIAEAMRATNLVPTVLRLP